MATCESYLRSKKERVQERSSSRAQCTRAQLPLPSWCSGHGSSHGSLPGPQSPGRRLDLGNRVLQLCVCMCAHTRTGTAGSAPDTRVQSLERVGNPWAVRTQIASVQTRFPKMPPACACVRRAPSLQASSAEALCGFQKELSIL